jgi:hypothetical protein
MDATDIHSALVKMGYKLKDCGNHWRTNALYRDGQNPTALLIYKDSGVWTDYVKNTPSLPFKDLVSATIKSNDKNDISKYISGSLETLSTAHVEKISSEKIFPESTLDKLLPHYSFYEKKGIDKDVLVNLKSGLATEGSMYQRYVFPIYNEFNQIHGFSGRDMNPDSGKDRPKWKHVGRKNNWIYPCYVKDKDKGESRFLKSIFNKKEVYLIESIGDLLSLHSAGIFNCIPIFGTSISSKLMCFLLSLDINMIHLCLNNDTDKDKNRGEIGVVKNLSKMCNCFDKHKLSIFLPTKNDFGDMSTSEILSWEDNKPEESNIDSTIVQKSKTMLKDGDINKACFNKIERTFN